MSEGWTAIVLAGQRPGRDPLAEAFGQELKALIPVGGVAMVRRVVETLLATPTLARVVVLAQDVGAIGEALEVDARLRVLSSGDGISASIAQVAGSDAAPWPVLVTTADHPLLTRDMIETFLARAGAHDVAIGMIERATFAARFPDNRRTWLKFRGGAYSGANLFALRTTEARAALDLWAGAERDRKQALRLFWHFGPLLALRAATRTIGLDDALRRAGQRLGLAAGVVLLDQAEAAIDVDRPADHALAEALLAQRGGT